MPKGYMLAELEITDPALFEKYRAKVPATIAAYGGRYLVRGGEPQPLEGDHPLRRFVVIEFASPEQAKNWYHSGEYAPLKEMRMRAAKTHALLLNGVEA
jgi:uncharacterized protein (DUF1330 family)